MKKNIFLILISVFCLIAGTWTIVDLYKNTNKYTTHKLDLSNLDLSKIEINIEGQDLTRPYIDSINTSHPTNVRFNISTNTDNDNINDLNTLFTSSANLFETLGAPNRFKTVVKNSNSYVYDEYGFYIKTNEQMDVVSYSIYFQKGTLDVAPKKEYNGTIKIDGIDIMSTFKIKSLDSKLNVQDYLAPHNYILRGADENIIFNFDSPSETLVNILIEKK
jgi:hypothetical protein